MFLKDVHSPITGEIPVTKHKEQNPCVQRWGFSRKARPEDVTPWFVLVLSQLTVQAAGFLVPLGPARAALEDSLLLHPVHLLVNRVVSRPVGKGSVREQPKLLLLSLPPHQQHTALRAHLWDFSFSLHQKFCWKRSKYSKLHPGNIQQLWYAMATYYSEEFVFRLVNGE